MIKSILNSDSIGYARVDGFYENGLLTYAYGQYDTYGDGQIQHSAAYRIGRERFTDFCLSMASFMLATPLGQEPFHLYAHELGLNRLEQGTIEFLLKVKYDEAHPNRYFSPNLGKITSNTDKRHDKRYFEIPKFADGSPESAWRLYWHCRESNGCLLERYGILQQFIEHTGSNFRTYAENVEPWIEQLPGDHGQAFRAMKSAWQSREAADWAQRLIESAVHNSTPKQTAAA